MGNKKAIQTILAYHERTKHHPDRFAQGPGRMDWANEPLPFRFYEGTAPLRLPLDAVAPDAPYASLHSRSGITSQPFSRDAISSFFLLSLGLSAWKSYGGSSWPLRMNPSSGNLHPTEAYPILPPMPGVDASAVFHYNPYLHALEPRIGLAASWWDSVTKDFGCPVFFVALSSIPWREAWKYGERAFRYCQLDIGHAVACVSFAAALHGWKAVWLNAHADRELSSLIGLDRTPWHRHEEEFPELLLAVCGKDCEPSGATIPAEAIRQASSFPCAGTPNRLSGHHRDWEIIGTAFAAAEKDQTDPFVCRPGPALSVETSPARNAVEILRQRRSAQAYDGKTGMTKAAFLGILDRTVPRRGCAPFDACPGAVGVHLLLFVHRVSGLEPGVYLFCRERSHLPEIRQKCSGDLLWEEIPGATQQAGLFLLARCDCREVAATISCFQEIAGDSAFSLGMLALFRPAIEQGAWHYRRLYWECGMIGQVLYLEAEANGLRGTGIGCFLDDSVHRIVGLQDDTFQSLYHFTVGGPIEDSRITTLPAYHHLNNSTG